MKPKERALAIREAFADGRSLDELVDDFDASRRTVQRILTGKVFPDVGGPTTELRPGRPSRELPERTARKVRRLRKRGATLDQLAAAAGCSTWTIRRILSTSEV